MAPTVSGLLSANLRLIPDSIEDLSAAGVPVAYRTAQMTLSLAGFAKGRTVLSPAIGGSVGNAVTQIGRAQGAETRDINHD